MVSSAYCRDRIPLHIIETGYPLSKVMQKPLKPKLAALSSILLKTSPTKLKSKGDIGSPCLKPLLGLNYVMSSPFTIISTDPPTLYSIKPQKGSSSKPYHMLFHNLALGSPLFFFLIETMGNFMCNHHTF
jgi:hypothetical protein